MNPRKFWDFCKSKIAKVILVLGLIGIGGALFFGYTPPAMTTKPEPLSRPQGGSETNQPTSVDQGGPHFLIPSVLSPRGRDNEGTNAAPTNAPPVPPITPSNSAAGEPQREKSEKPPTPITPYNSGASEPKGEKSENLPTPITPQNADAGEPELLRESDVPILSPIN
jgi:hypothetical protein